MKVSKYLCTENYVAVYHFIFFIISLTIHMYATLDSVHHILL